MPLPRFTGLLGLITFLALAYAFSTNRRAIRWRTVAWGLGLQVLFAFLVIKWTYGQHILATISGVITGLLGHSVDGSSLVFGALGNPKSALSVFALGGTAIGKFDGDTKGVPGPDLGLWPSTNARPAFSVGANLDLNLYPNIAFRIAPTYLGTTFGGTVQNSKVLNIGIVYRFGKPK